MVQAVRRIWANPAVPCLAPPRRAGRGKNLMYSQFNDFFFICIDDIVRQADPVRILLVRAAVRIVRQGGGECVGWRGSFSG
jgi:hypothetical protein